MTADQGALRRETAPVPEQDIVDRLEKELEHQRAYTLKRVRRWFRDEYPEIDDMGREEQEELFDEYLQDLHDAEVITDEARTRWTLDGIGRTLMRDGNWLIVALPVLVVLAVSLGSRFDEPPEP